MQKIKQIIFLCFLFTKCLSSFAFVNIIDAKKIAFIENLAEPLLEDKTFYRWQSETSKDNLLSAEELTSDLHNYFMSMKTDPKRQAMGKGVYVAQDPVSSKDFGETLIEVEIKQGQKFLDITNPDIMRQLTAKGITVQNLKELPSSVIISYDNNFMVIKGREGVTFKPFSTQGISLEQLNLVIEDRPLVKNDATFRQAILDRFSNNPGPILTTTNNSPFLKIVEKAQGKQYIQNTLHQVIENNSIQTLDEGARLLRSTSSYYLSPQDRQKLIKQSKNLPIESAEAVISFIRSANTNLSIADREHLFNKAPITSVTEGAQVLEHGASYLSANTKKQILQQIAKVTRSEQDLNYLKRHLPEADYETIRGLRQASLPLSVGSTLPKKPDNKVRGGDTINSQRLRCLRAQLIKQL